MSAHVYRQNPVAAMVIARIGPSPWVYVIAVSSKIQRFVRAEICRDRRAGVNVDGGGAQRGGENRARVSAGRSSLNASR